MVRGSSANNKAAATRTKSDSKNQLMKQLVKADRSRKD